MNIFLKSPISHQMFLPVFFIFLINPTVAMIHALATIGTARVDEKSKGKYYLAFLFLSSWLGVINMTKIPASDQGAYLGLFAHAHVDGFYKTVFMAWGESSKEVLYGIYTWVMHYICIGNGALFFFYTTVIIYMFHFVSAYKIMEKLGVSKNTLLCGILVLAFFTQYFNLTNHLVRQMLASGVVLYGITRRICGEKRWWAWVIASVFVHTSAGLLAAMAFVPQLYKKMNKKQMILIGGTYFAFIVVVASFSSYLESFSGDGNGALNYGISRLASNETDGGGIELSTMLMVIIPVVAGIIFSLFSSLIK